MLRNFLKSFLLSLLLLAGGAFTAADLPLKAVHFEPPFLCSRAEAAISMTFDEMYAGVSSLGITFSDKLKNSEGIGCERSPNAQQKQKVPAVSLVIKNKQIKQPSVVQAN